MKDKLPQIFGAGLGLRRAFIEEAAERPPDGVSFYEIAPENYVGRGGLAPACLEKIAAQKPLLAHGLTLSVGSLEEMDWKWLHELKTFIRRWRIPWFSDHLCFSSAGGAQFHELLPLPFTLEAACHAAERARMTQDFLEVPFALENVSFYLHPEPPEMSEADFVNEVLERSGTGLLLDVNNALVNALNHGTDPMDFLGAVPREKVFQIHLAGHERVSPELVIDTHGHDVPADVWALLAKWGEGGALPPVIIERDGNFPGLETLAGEVRRAASLRKKSLERQREKESA